MVTTLREIERKYELAAGRQAPDFHSLAGVSAQLQDAELVLEAVYFDTADLRLAAAGITLRRRRGGSDAGWHLKVPVEGDARDELSIPVDDEVPAIPPAAIDLSASNGTESAGGEAVPTELVDRVLVHSRGSELRPVALITTHRARWLLRDSSQTVLAEFVLDNVSAQARHPATASEWREIEVELVAGDGQLLDRVDDWLAGAGIHRSAAPSKLARVLGDQLPVRRPVADAPPPDRLRPATPSGAVLRAYLHGQVRRLHNYDPLVRVDAPDAVHQMRVTTRRIRSALRTYRSLLDAEPANQARAELAWLAGVLGGARDAEVMAARLGAELAALPSELVVGSVANAIAAYFAGEHAAAHEFVRAELRSARYFALLDSLDELLTSARHTRAARAAARKSLPKAVSRAYRRLAAAVDQIEHSAADERDLAIHEARKAAKRARYAAELATAALGKDAKRFAAQMKLLQECLGEHQDSVVARAEILRLSAEGPDIAGGPFTLGVLYGQQRVAAEAVEDEIPGVWRAVAKAKYRSWLR